MSRSARLRSAGNAAFASGSTAKLGAALHFYQLAIDSASGDSELASACKNAGAASARLADFAAKDATDGSQDSAAAASMDHDAAGRHYTDALSFQLQALEAGSAAGNSDDWLEHCLQQARSAIDHLMDDVLPELAVDAALDILALGSDIAISAAKRQKRASLAAGVPALVAKWHLEHAQHLFHTCIKQQSKDDDDGDGGNDDEGIDDWKLRLRLLAEAARPLQLCEQLLAAYGEEADEMVGLLAEQLEDLQESIFLHTCSCNSIQCRLQADDVLDQAVNVDEDINMDGVYAAVDLYKQAALLTKEHDLENEASALSALGRLYDNVLSDEERATRYMKRVLELAEAMAPRVVTREPWYQDARAILMRYQSAKVRKEEAEEAKRREPLLKLLEQELEAMKRAANKGSEALLKHVYEKHPPRNPEHKLAKPTPDTLQDLLKTAIVHYHPDKQRSAQHEDLWCVLCEEITKELTRKYQIFK